ncbi:C-type cytochrome, methanol metabolism-related [Methylocella tundrae]|uniref:C-type cytochrome, methanol metabolism-related n=2 Tax=Methylocella tundrae TaxID=227605 RepID=A0A8B6M8N4_METTU|nr:C-type cytochrome, methanol metabolism-related [Methylocella tundrae]VTZ51230.1 C-type cytochrome, methanol metabolism-related [Methylocella tundrae]
MKFSSASGLFVFAVLASSAGFAMAEAPGDPTAVKQNDLGKWFDAKGDPTYKIEPDKNVDWFTYSGFRRYHSECHVCHGPDGEGSSYAPALKNSVKTLNYAEFVGVVVGGRQNVTSSQENVMPAFGDNKNVMCYLDDIYVYLRARSTDAVERGRPAGHVEKTPAAIEAEKACIETPG